MSRNIMVFFLYMSRFETCKLQLLSRNKYTRSRRKVDRGYTETFYSVMIGHRRRRYRRYWPRSLLSFERLFKEMLLIDGSPPTRVHMC